MLLEAPTDFLGPTDFTDSTDSSGSMGKSDSADFSDLKITAEEYAEWAEKICKIGVKEEVLDAISAIRKSLRAVNVDEAAERRNIYVSDRRWKNIVRLLRTSGARTMTMVGAP